jgi:Tfp pilus assembly protein PilX
MIASRSNFRRHQRLPARGAALIAALIALTIVATLATIMTQSYVALERENRLALRRLQANALVESGLERGAAQLAKNADFAGETWTIETKDSGLDLPATVIIRVARTRERRQLEVEAALGQDDSQVAAKRTLELAPPISDSPPSEAASDNDK